MAPACCNIHHFGGALFQHFPDASKNNSEFCGIIPFIRPLYPKNMESPQAADFQRQLFRHFIAQVGEKMAVARLCELLNLNKSSVYKRMAGEQLIKLDELLLLIKKLDLAVDELFPANHHRISWQFPTLQQPIRSCREYLLQVSAYFDTFALTPGLRIWFSANSLPLFQHLQFRELALFKIFAYARINWQLPYSEALVFDPQTFPEREIYEELMQPILAAYLRLPTIEFWSDDLYYSTLQQIRYFSKSGQLQDPALIQLLYDQLQLLCTHQYDMARHGQKWTYGAKRSDVAKNSGKFDLYYNEIAPLNITLLAESPTLYGVFTVFDDPNFMFTSNEPMYAYSLAWMNKLKAKCIHISEDGEQGRRAYFQALQNQITAQNRRAETAL